MDLSAQARQSAQQGQQLLAQDRAQSSQAKNQYTTYSNQATQANKNLQSEAAYMKGAGSGLNVYNTELGNLQKKSGYNPAQLAAANKSLFSINGALNGANTAFNTPGGVGGYGMSAGALGSYEGSVLAPLQTGVANANTEVGTLNNELGTLQTGASQATTSQVQSEQNTVTALTAAVQNYQAQATASLQNMQLYSELAQKQGGLNAQEQQNYAAAQASYAQAAQAMAQSKLILASVPGVQATSTAQVNQLNSQEAAQQQKAAQAKSNAQYNAMGGTALRPKAPTAAKPGGSGIVSNLGSLFKNFASVL